MKRLSFYYESVSDLSPDDEHKNLAFRYIIQHPQMSGPQFKLRKRIGS